MIANGEFQGVGSEYLNKNIYFPYNFTLVDYNSLTGPIEKILHDEVDIIFTLSTLRQLPSNITTGPVFNYLRCYMVGRNFIRNEILQQEVGDTLSQVDMKSGVVFGIVLGFLLICLQIFVRIGITKSLWYMIAIFLRNFSGFRLKRTSQILILAMLLLLAFLSQTLLSCFIQTNRISRPDGTRVETYDDIIKQNLTLDISYVGKCNNSFYGSGDTVIKKLGQHLFKGPVVTFEDWIHFHPRYFVLMEENFGVSAIEAACIMHRETYGQLVLTSKPSIEAPESQYYHKNLEKKKRHKLVQWGYASLEMGFYQRERLIQVETLRSSLKTRADAKCVTPVVHKSEFYPLGITFFHGILNFIFLLWVDIHFFLLVDEILFEVQD